FGAWRMFSCARFIAFSFLVPATSEIYTLSLHDALPIYVCAGGVLVVDLVVHAPDGARGAVERVDDQVHGLGGGDLAGRELREAGDRKSTRLNSSHVKISYAVFCLKKKTTNEEHQPYHLT